MERSKLGAGAAMQAGAEEREVDREKSPALRLATDENFNGRIVAPPGAGRVCERGL